MILSRYMYVNEIRRILPWSRDGKADEVKCLIMDWQSGFFDISNDRRQRFRQTQRYMEWSVQNTVQPNPVFIPSDVVVKSAFLIGPISLRSSPGKFGNQSQFWRTPSIPCDGIVCHIPTLQCNVNVRQHFECPYCQPGNYSDQSVVDYRPL